MEGGVRHGKGYSRAAVQQILQWSPDLLPGVMRKPRNCRRSCCGCLYKSLSQLTRWCTVFPLLALPCLQEPLDWLAAERKATDWIYLWGVAGRFKHTRNWSIKSRAEKNSLRYHRKPWSIGQRAFTSELLFRYAALWNRKNAVKELWRNQAASHTPKTNIKEKIGGTGVWIITMK